MHVYDGLQLDFLKIIITKKTYSNLFINIVRNWKYISRTKFHVFLETIKKNKKKSLIVYYNVLFIPYGHVKCII